MNVKYREILQATAGPREDKLEDKLIFQFWYGSEES